MSDSPLAQTIKAEAIRQRTFHRWLIAFAVVAVCLVGIRCGWGHIASTRLADEINKIKAAGERFDPDDFVVRDVPADDDNAAVLYLRATDALVDDDVGDVSFSDLLYFPSSYSRHPQSVWSIIEANHEALAQVRKIRPVDNVVWRTTVARPMWASNTSYLSEIRRLERFLGVAAMSNFQQGNQAEAIEIVRDMLILANRTQYPSENCDSLARLVSIANWARTLQVLEELTPTLIVSNSADGFADVRTQLALRKTVEELIKTILDEHDVWAALDDALVFERASSIDAMEQYFSSNGVGFRGPAVAPNAIQDFAGFVILRPVIDLDETRLIRRFNEMRDVIKSRSWRLVCEFYSKVDLDADENNVRRIAKMLSKLLTPSFKRGFELTFRSIAIRRMAATALAIRLYEIDHGRRPSVLAELVPDYLDVIPIDPFDSTGKPIRYLPNRKQPLLYSVNQDNTDDQGEFATKDIYGVDQDVLDLVYFLDGDRPAPVLAELESRFDD